MGILRYTIRDINIESGHPPFKGLNKMVYNASSKPFEAKTAYDTTLEITVRMAGMKLHSAKTTYKQGRRMFLTEADVVGFNEVPITVTIVQITPKGIKFGNTSIQSVQSVDNRDIQDIIAPYVR